MKSQRLWSVACLVGLSLISSLNPAPLVFGFPLPSIKSPSQSSSPKPSSQQTFVGFSGQFSEYKDTYNGFKLKVPVEFQLNSEGATTIWTAPVVDGGAPTIYINTVEMKGVSSQVLYDTNLKAKQQDRNYTDITPVSVNFGNQKVLAFRFKEANNQPGSPKSKTAEDIHRWHLLVFGNGRFYTLGFTGLYGSFQQNRLQSLYDQVIGSIELIPAQ